MYKPSQWAVAGLLQPTHIWHGIEWLRRGRNIYDKHTIYKQQAHFGSFPRCKKHLRVKWTLHIVQTELSKCVILVWLLFVSSFKLHFQKPVGILSILDEESRFPKATDKSLATKLHSGPGNKFSHVEKISLRKKWTWWLDIVIRNSALIFFSLLLGKMSPKVYLIPKDGGLTFSVMHYAGKVSYNMEGVLDKNRDTLPTSILFTMKGEWKYVLNVSKCMLRWQNH